MSQVIKNLASGPVPPYVPVDFYTDDGNFAVAQLQRLNVYTPGNGTQGIMTTSAGAGTGNTITIAVKTDAFAWNEEAINFNAAAQNGYFCSAALTATLPNAPPFGTTIIIYADTASAVTIQAQGSDKIEIATVTGAAAGTATATQQGANVELVYRVTDTTWHGLNVTGTWSVM